MWWTLSGRAIPSTRVSYLATLTSGAWSGRCDSPVHAAHYPCGWPAEPMGSQRGKRPCSMYLDEIIAAQKNGQARGIASICSAHPRVIERALATFEHPLIEATCNQVNQYG